MYHIAGVILFLCWSCVGLSNHAAGWHLYENTLVTFDEMLSSVCPMFHSIYVNVSHHAVWSPQTAHFLHHRTHLWPISLLNVDLWIFVGSWLFQIIICLGPSNDIYPRSDSTEILLQMSNGGFSHLILYSSRKLFMRTDKPTTLISVGK